MLTLDLHVTEWRSYQVDGFVTMLAPIPALAGANCHQIGIDVLMMAAFVSQTQLGRTSSEADEERAGSATVLLHLASYPSPPSHPHGLPTVVTPALGVAVTCVTGVRQLLRSCANPESGLQG